MNKKIARQLRKEANYKPSQPRQYQVVNKSRKQVSPGVFKQGTVELVDSDPRTLYLELKKEYKG